MKLATIRDTALIIASTAITGAFAYAVYDSRKLDQRHREFQAEMAAREARIKPYSSADAPAYIPPAL